jgi:hypothetical protein
LKEQTNKAAMLMPLETLGASSKSKKMCEEEDVANEVKA